MLRAVIDGLKTIGLWEVLQILITGGIIIWMLRKIGIL